MKITYKKGSQPLITDTLSYAYLTKADDVKVGGDGKEELEEINLVAELSISEERLDNLMRAAVMDQTLQKIRDYDENGWPTTRQYIPSDVLPYHSFRNEISYQHGLIFKFGRILVPQALQDDLMKQLHSSHLGLEGCLRRA